MAQLNDPGWDDLFDAAAKKYDIDPRLLKAVMYAETGGGARPENRVTDTSSAGAVGPMQLLPSSFPNVDWYDPAHAIPHAARYLAEGRSAVGDDPVKMLLYYHGGPEYQKNMGPESRAYPGAVARYYSQLVPQGAGVDLNEFFGGNLPKSLQTNDSSRAASPVPAVGSTAPPSGAVPVGLAPGEAEAMTIGKTAIPKTIGNLYDSLSKLYENKGIFEQNLRNAAAVFEKIQAGASIPLQSELGRYAKLFGIDTTKFGSADPGLVQEAKKAASAALYSSVAAAPGLVSDMYERQNLKPDVTLEPNAAKSLIANGLASIDMRSDWLKDINSYAHPTGPGKGSITGYDQTSFNQDMPNRVKKAYATLPKFAGEGDEPPVIGAPVVPPSSVTVSPNQPSVFKDKSGNYYQALPDGTFVDLKSGKPYGQ